MRGSSQFLLERDRCGASIVDKIVCWMFFPRGDAWQLTHGKTTMLGNLPTAHLNSDEELMPSFYESDSPDSEDDNDFLPDFEFDTVESYLEFCGVGF